jgi:TolA-binding protein
MNIVRDGDEPEVTVVIPEEVAKALDVIRKHVADPTQLEKLRSQRVTAESQLKEAKEKVEQLEGKIEAIDKQIETMEENEELFKKVDDAVKEAS